jgi:hypothetical protein
VHLERLSGLEADRREIDVDPACLLVLRIDVRDRDDDVLAARLAEADDLLVVRRMKPQRLVLLQ